jgi:uncharacterized caspase-like protein
MARVALLIGVGQYGTDLKPLSAPPKDVEAIKEVLENWDMGAFDHVEPLIDPTHSKMREKIELWLNERKSDDLALLYFSGHGVKDERRELFFAAGDTRLINKNQLIKATAVRAKEVHEHIHSCKAERLVLILDCCFSGAFGNTVGKGDDNSIDLSEMGATGRIVLTSSSAIQSSLEQQDQELSTYTHYLVQGIRTGVADQKENEGNEDGWISVDELHQYVCREMEKARSSMNPKIISLRDEGHRIKLVKAPAIDPKMRYRRKLIRLAQQNDGEIYDGNLLVLKRLKNQLNLLEEDVKTIEDEVLHPYKVRREKQREYEQDLSELARKQYPLNQKDSQAIKEIQEILGLRDEDVEPVHQKIDSQFSSQSTVKLPNPQPIESKNALPTEEGTISATQSTPTKPGGVEPKTVGAGNETNSVDESNLNKTSTLKESLTDSVSSEQRVDNTRSQLQAFFANIARFRNNKLLAGGTIVSISALTLIAVYTYLWFPELWSSAKIKVQVKGQSDPWLAGMPDKTQSSICKGSVSSGKPQSSRSPENSPTEVKGISLIRGGYLTFTATGSVKIRYDSSTYEPEGNPDHLGTHEAEAENGISDINARYNSLIGVFLGAEQPDKDPAPSTLDFKSADRQNYFTLSPKLKQVFFIGDGRIFMGIKQRVIVPPGAKRLYLGTMDGCGWENNGGYFDVEVTSSSKTASKAE